MKHLCHGGRLAVALLTISGSCVMIMLGAGCTKPAETATAPSNAAAPTAVSVPPTVPAEAKTTIATSIANGQASAAAYAARMNAQNQKKQP